MRKRLSLAVQTEATAVARLSDPLRRAAVFVARVKDDGTTGDFAQQLAAAKQQLSERRRLQARLQTLLVDTKKQLTGVIPEHRR